MPRLVVVLSGKRKSGKDHVATRLQQELQKNGVSCALVRLSAPLKRTYALEHGLDFAELLTDSAYKEQSRAAMIAWGEEQRRRDVGYFCRAACADADSDALVWVVTDARRPTDLVFFQNHYDPVMTVRIEASDEVRRQRGWVFVAGIDDADSECALDAHDQWTLRLRNEGDARSDEEFASFIDRLQKSANNPVDCQCK